MTAVVRPYCLRCRRATVVCVCAELQAIPSRTRVVFVQHPREARMAVSTCRLAHLSLPNSEMHVGMGPEAIPALRGVTERPGTVLLFPGPGSVDVRELAAHSETPHTVIVVDGTWINARKLVERSPLLAALPRVGFTPLQPSNYRIRREPALHCVSTIEAVVHVLEQLEQAPGRFAPMLASFERMVDLQIDYSQSGLSGRAPRARKPSALERLRALGDRLVLVFAEGNVSSERKGEPPEMLHWVALRPATGERFASILEARRPLAEHVPRNLGLSLEQLATGEPLERAVARWRTFCRPDDVWSTWGRYSLDLLRSEQIEVGDCVDVKSLVLNVANTSLGGIERIAESLGITLPEREGRAMRKVIALNAVMEALLGAGLPADHGTPEA